jgi:hypothetical protein
MWDECQRYIESKARTDRLWCSNCRKAIRKGDQVVFDLDISGSRERMREVYCADCGKEYEYEVTCDTQHPFEIDG